MRRFYHECKWYSFKPESLKSWPLIDNYIHVMARCVEGEFMTANPINIPDVGPIQSVSVEIDDDSIIYAHLNFFVLRSNKPFHETVSPGHNVQNFKVEAVDYMKYLLHHGKLV